MNPQNKHDRIVNMIVSSSDCLDRLTSMCLVIRKDVPLDMPAERNYSTTKPIKSTSGENRKRLANISAAKVFES